MGTKLTFFHSFGNLLVSKQILKGPNFLTSRKKCNTDSYKQLYWLLINNSRQYMCPKTSKTHLSFFDPVSPLVLYLHILIYIFTNLRNLHVISRTEKNRSWRWYLRLKNTIFIQYRDFDKIMKCTWYFLKNFLDIPGLRKGGFWYT